jgi:hypothetical protein
MRCAVPKMASLFLLLEITHLKMTSYEILTGDRYYEMRTLVFRI